MNYGLEVFVWVGRTTQLDDRKAAQASCRALLKQQQGGGPKGKEKNVPVAEEIVPPLLNSNGKLEVLITTFFLYSFVLCVRSLDAGGKEMLVERIALRYLTIRGSKAGMSAGEKGRRIRKLTIIFQKRFKFPDMLNESITEGSMSLLKLSLCVTSFLEGFNGVLMFVMGKGAKGCEVCYDRRYNAGGCLCV
ncbi:villin/Gelsolin, ADF-H/Gelsolin-like domain protein [Artemisia annua]|uniref:Villin/Gelsolin, ADF-H/Gelsolin-like domain protein n=1 Tax=Artemisia annua TaxID=35608 RepID=A0A2U1LX12_ARTAN|nr:villin/Gelsolin, ADF-H/Gelsolin-like domain protein [Artemisia annua]